LTWKDNRSTVARLVVPDMHAWVEDDDGCIDLVIADVLARWQTRGSDEPARLGGHGGFWCRYANRVEYAPPGSENEYRAEFCAPGEKLNTDEYYFRVWAAHIAGLRQAAPPAMAVGGR
jgi:hypothetical protein